MNLSQSLGKLTTGSSGNFPRLTSVHYKLRDFSQRSSTLQKFEELIQLIAVQETFTSSVNFSPEVQKSSSENFKDFFFVFLEVPQKFIEFAQRFSEQF